MIHIITAFLLILLTNSHSIPITRHIPDSTVKSSDCTTTGANNETILGFGNCFNNIYFINIEIGTPSQTLGVQFDTGSNILWVPTEKTIGNSKVFNTTASSTFKNTSLPGKVQYADGSGVSGTYGTDIFQISSTSINITTRYLWVTTQKMKYPSEIQGLVGMGFTNIPNFLDVAYKNGQIDSPVFALQILSDNQQSLVHYNEIPEEIVNTTFFEPVYSPYYWGVRVTGMEVGGVDMTGSAASLAVIDSGTSYFYLNEKLYQQVIGQYFSDCHYVQNVPVCPCKNVKNWPTFSFSFTKIKVEIEPQDYAAKLSTFQCSYLFGSISSFSQILLGDIFFRNYIVTFDNPNKRIGFSAQNIEPAQHDITEADIIIGWIMFAILSIIFIFGVVSCICLDISIGQFAKRDGFFFPEFQLSNSSLSQPLQ